MNIRAAPQNHFLWLLDRAQVVASPAFRGIEAIDDFGKIHGMAGFDGWTANSVVVSIALDNPGAFRHLVHAIFEFAFVQARRGVVLATVKGSNTRSRKLCEHVGFREVYKIRDGVDVGEDLILFEMRREECRWIAEEYRKAA